MDASLHAVGEETRAQRRAAFQECLRLGPRLPGIGSNACEDLLNLSESDNFFSEALVAAASMQSFV